MSGFDHDIKINNQIYHIQTKRTVKHQKEYALTHIFLNGIVFWTNQQAFHPTLFENMTELLEKMHQEAFNFLKNRFANEKQINLFKINHILNLFLQSIEPLVRSASIYSFDTGLITPTKHVTPLTNYLPRYHDLLHSPSKILGEMKQLTFFFSKQHLLLIKISETPFTLGIESEYKQLFNRNEVAQLIDLINHLYQFKLLIG